MPVEVQTGKDGVTFAVKVQPGAKKTELAGVWEKALKIKVAKKADDGAANAECLAYLAQCLGVSRKALSIIKGEYFTHKIIRVVGLSEVQVRNGLLRNMKTTA